MIEVADQDPDRIAIIGMAGRFPGAGDVETFWTNLEQGREGITTFTDEELLAAGVDPRLLGQDGYVRAKGVLEDADRFDEGFFGYSPREAELLDPQHRVFLECAWQALETAGVDPQTFDGRIGVFAGAGLNSYLLFNLMNNQQVLDSAGLYQVMLATDKDFLATRVSYKLDLTGPERHRPDRLLDLADRRAPGLPEPAQRRVRHGAGRRRLGHLAAAQDGYQHEPGGILSPDGHCRAFDADAAGTVPATASASSCCAASRTRSPTATPSTRSSWAPPSTTTARSRSGTPRPASTARREVIAEALAVADVDPATVGYVEAHGTGTPLGDPIEVAALTQVFRAGHPGRTATAPSARSRPTSATWTPPPASPA